MCIRDRQDLWSGETRMLQDFYCETLPAHGFRLFRAVMRDA